MAWSVRCTTVDLRRRNSALRPSGRPRRPDGACAGYFGLTTCSGCRCRLGAPDTQIALLRCSRPRQIDDPEEDVRWWTTLPRRPTVEVLDRDVKNKGKLGVSVVFDRTSNRLRIQLAVRHHARGDASVMPCAPSAANYRNFTYTQQTARLRETRAAPSRSVARTIARRAPHCVAGTDSCVLGGESGIRTHGTLLTYTRFPSVRLKPLGHLSAGADSSATAGRRSCSSAHDWKKAW